MKTSYIFSGILLMAIVTFIACKKDKALNTDIVIEAIEVNKLSTAFVQAGDELTIFGSHLVQEDLVTEVFINGRLSEILRSSADSITVRVPLKVQTGKVMVTVSKDTRFSSVYGPVIEIKPTPLIKNFWPLFAFGGDTIELYTENFSEVEQDNAIFLGSQKLEIVSRKGKDTILVKLPLDAITNVFSWNTYRGPAFQMETSFKVRQTNYMASSVAEWFLNDPGFSFMDTLVRAFPALAENYDIHKPIFDTALQYINSAQRTYTIFASGDAGYYKNNITKPAHIEGIQRRPFRYNSMLAAAIVPDHNVRISEMRNGDTYATAYTKKLAFYDYPIETDDWNYIKIIVQDGVKYAQIWGPYDETRPMQKILRETTIGNATLIETEGELGVVNF